MTSAAVAWVLDQVASVVDAQPAAHPLRRVDRDNSQVYEGSQAVSMSDPPQERTEDFKHANFVGASFVDRTGSAIGPEYNLDLETVVGVRIEGYSGSYGHIDPDGSDAVEFEALVNDIRKAIYAGRTFPDAGRADVSFTHLIITNEAPQSDLWEEYYRHDFDVAFNGFETL